MDAKRNLALAYAVKRQALRKSELKSEQQEPAIEVEEDPVKARIRKIMFDFKKSNKDEDRDE